LRRGSRQCRAQSEPRLSSGTVPSPSDARTPAAARAQRFCWQPIWRMGQAPTLLRQASVHAHDHESSVAMTACRLRLKLNDRANTWGPANGRQRNRCQACIESRQAGRLPGASEHGGWGAHRGRAGRRPPPCRSHRRRSSRRPRSGAARGPRPPIFAAAARRAPAREAARRSWHSVRATQAHAALPPSAADESRRLSKLNMAAARLAGTRPASGEAGDRRQGAVKPWPLRQSQGRGTSGVCRFRYWYARSVGLPTPYMQNICSEGALGSGQRSGSTCQVAASPGSTSHLRARARRRRPLSARGATARSGAGTCQQRCLSPQESGVVSQRRRRRLPRPADARDARARRRRGPCASPRSRAGCGAGRAARLG